MGLAGQRGQGGGDFTVGGGADIGRGSAGVAAAVGVPGVGAGDGVAEVAAVDPRQCGATPSPVGQTTYPAVHGFLASGPL